MDQCINFNSTPVWLVVLMAVLSHARGTALLMKAVGLFLWRFTCRGRARRQRHRLKS